MQPSKAMRLQAVFQCIVCVSPTQSTFALRSELQYRPPVLPTLQVHCLLEADCTARYHVSPMTFGHDCMQADMSARFVISDRIRENGTSGKKYGNAVFYIAG